MISRIPPFVLSLSSRLPWRSLNRKSMHSLLRKSYSFFNFSLSMFFCSFEHVFELHLLSFQLQTYLQSKLVIGEHQGSSNQLSTIMFRIKSFQEPCTIRFRNVNLEWYPFENLQHQSRRVLGNLSHQWQYYLVLYFYE